MQILKDLQQGSEDWLRLRKTKITATDAPIIMGASHWKTKECLMEEKLSNDPPEPATERMLRGIELEPIARELFNIKTGLEMNPVVIIDSWRMASLDGMTDDNKNILEIKCAGDRDHRVALWGKVPGHYYDQLQHQMSVCGLQKMYYFSFDGFDGVIVEVHYCKNYADKLLQKEKEFYEELMEKMNSR